MELLACGFYSSSVPTECTAEPCCLQQTESPVKRAGRSLDFAHWQAHTILFSIHWLAFLEGSVGTNLCKRLSKRQAESELILESKHPLVTPLVESVTRLWCAVCQQDPSHSWTWVSVGFLGSWLSQCTPTLTSVTYIFDLTFFYLFLTPGTPGTQWVKDLILCYCRDFQARSEVCQNIHTIQSIRADMLMSLWKVQDWSAGSSNLNKFQTKFYLSTKK